ncbi:helix-turn-helix domain-containing protein [Cellulomonas sp. ATA003]|uniref:helix-turn-helix domain-containing protein n=1 Tax=Cellulomonas sp. ATA003 TaxID=3073064 RepID=UPI0028731A50|nr:helix-turn-helix domain-containing protein [Cellulomonas sp. ATA003]WNB86150.1 helix-turn-helix domain-containing protein [Cellulomonas sp. ATA003]
MSATAQVHITTDRGVREDRVLNVVVENDDRLLLSVVEAARRLGIGRTLMYDLLAAGEITSVHVGRLHKIPVGALDAYIARLTATVPEVR